MDLIKNLLSSLINAEYDLGGIRELFGKLSAKFIGNADIAALWDKFLALITPYATIVPIVMIALCAVVLFFGKKLLPLLRFLAFVVVGYGAGVIVVSPLINKFFALPSFVSGIVIAIVAGVLSKVFYYLAVVAGTAYLAYMVTYTGKYVPQVTSFTAGNQIVCIAVAVVAVILVLLLLKYFEMAGTAFIGAMFISKWVTANYIDYAALVPFNPVIVELAVVAVIALIGFIVQVKTRTRY